MEVLILQVFYMVMLILNKGQNVEDYMTFGYYAMFSAIYVIIYSYYNIFYGFTSKNFVNIFFQIY